MSKPFTPAPPITNITYHGDILLTITLTSTPSSTQIFFVDSDTLTKSSKYFDTLLSPSSPFSEALAFHSHRLPTPFPLHQELDSPAKL